ncbi:MAG: coproporphyrinogen dehydrogenase HemZ [Oscillospiraceae bacterium]|nr:coproporphyrinogen dehydrogenase HemZ [Oscillospiraceae bacterium]
MIIYFTGNSYKYEIEAVMKLFLPLERFRFVYDSDKFEQGDICIVSRNDNCLEVSVIFNGLSASKTQKQDNLSDELNLCRLLWLCMRELTGLTPPWGCLTGIRPVKKVNAMLNNGLGKEEVFRALKDDYFVSNEKAELAYQTALAQAEKLKKIEEQAFSLYISIPFCPSRCTYCSFVSHSIENNSAKRLISEYLDKLCTEIEKTAALSEELALYPESIYIGGGTPTSLSAENLDFLMKKVKKSFNLSKIREYTVEAGRPDTITDEKLAVIKENGAERISVNPQTLHDGVLRAIGREHSAKDFEKAYLLAREAGFDNINADIIAGLPTDTLDGFKNTVDTVAELSPESITVHTLTVKRASALFYEKAAVGAYSAEVVPQMVLYGQESLKRRGYIPYYLYRQKNALNNLENIGYSKKGFESLYNIYIMEEVQTILAVGAAASTKLFEPCSNRIKRVLNCKYPYEYISRFDARISEKESKIRDFYRKKLI